VVVDAEDGELKVEVESASGTAEEEARRPGDRLIDTCAENYR